MKFDGIESEAYSEFFENIEKYYKYSYNKISQAMLQKRNIFFWQYSEKEFISLLLLNKVLFQNIKGYFDLINQNLPLPAFSCLRSAVETFRLFRLYYIDETFRKDYVENKNFNFNQAYDRKFQQGNIIRKLDELETQLKKEDKIPIGSPILSNHLFTKGSDMSSLHSELSKWSHGLNINLYLQTMIIDKENIFIGIEDVYSEIMQKYIKRYTEGCYFIIAEQNSLLLNLLVSYDTKILDELDRMFNVYLKYVKIAYKK